MSSAEYISATIGQEVKLIVETFNSNGVRADDYIPSIISITNPDLTEIPGYPAEMTKLKTGIYYSILNIPAASTSVGTFIADIYWEENTVPKYKVFAINTNRPFGFSAVSPV